MIPYYIKLAWLSIRSTPMLSSLMMLIIAIGIATSMITYTVTYMMSQHPLEDKADTILKVYLSAWNASRPYKERFGEEQAPTVVTYQDYVNLSSLHDNTNIVKAYTPVATHKDLVRTTIQPLNEAKMRYMYSINNDFFSMFESPFLYGAPWTEPANNKGGLEVIISKPLNETLFAGENSVGQQLMIGKHAFTISGVLDEWNPIPNYFGYAADSYRSPHDIYVPFQTQINSELYIGPYFPIFCATYPETITFQTILKAECHWIDLWVELTHAQDRDDYTALLHSYDKQQKQAGRFPRPLPSKTRTISENLLYEGIVPENSTVAVWLAFAFLAVCLLNCMSLLINKFHNKRSEVGLRRAIGASKQNIALQFGFETALIGFFGGVFGLALAQVGLLGARNIFHFLNTNFIQMNITIMISTIVLSVLATCIFGLWPIYKAMQVQPSSQLKSL